MTTINTKTANDLVTSAANGIINMVTTYAGTSKAIQSSGTLITDLATNASVTAGLALKVAKAGDTMSGALAMGANNITNVATLSGATISRTADNILSCLTTPTYGNVAMFSTVNKSLEDSGLSSLNLVIGPASSAVNNIPVFSNLTGKAITTSTSTIGTIGALTLANTTASSSPITGTLILSGSGAGIGVNGKIYSADNHVIGPSSVTSILDHKLTLKGNVLNILGPHVAAYISTDQYPVFQQLNWGHDNIAQSFDSYYDNTSWKSSYPTSQYQIYKISNQLQFNYSPGATLGTTVTWANAGYIDTSGLLNWKKIINTTDTTDASSLTVGSIVTSGGIACAKQGRFGGKITVSTAASSQGLDLATADSYSNLRVIQNTSGSDNDIYLGYSSGALSSLHLYSNNNQTVYINRGNVVMGGAISTSATDGYVYIPTVPGVAAGVATAYAGCVPMVYDTSTNRLAIRSGGVWRSTLLS